MPLHDKPSPGQEQNPTLSGEQKAPPLASQQAGPPGPPNAPQPDPADYATSGTPAGPGPDEQNPGDAAIAYKDIDADAEQAAGKFGARQPGQEWMSDTQVRDQAIYDQQLAMYADRDKFGYHEVGKYNTYVHVPDPDRPVQRFARIRVIGQEVPPPGAEVDPNFFKQMLWSEKPGNYVEHTTIGGRPVRDIMTKQSILNEPHTPSMFMPAWADSPVEVYYPVYENQTDGEAVEELQRLGLESKLQEYHQYRSKLFGFGEAVSLGGVALIPGYAEAREDVADDTHPWVSESAFGAGHVMAIAPQMKVFGTIMQPIHKGIAAGFATSVEKAAAQQVAKTGATVLDDALMATQAAQQAGKAFSPTKTLSKLWQRQVKNVPSGTQRTLERAWQQAAETGAVSKGMLGETLVLGVPRNVWNSAQGATLRRAAEAYKMALGEEVAGSTLFKFVALSTNVAAGAGVDASLGTAQAAGAAMANQMLSPEQRTAQIRGSWRAGAEEGLVGATFEALTSAVPALRGTYAPGKVTGQGSSGSARPGHPGPPPGAVWGAGDTVIGVDAQPGAEMASPGASQHRSLQVVPPPTPGADVQGRNLADHIQQNLRNSLNDEVTAQVDHTLRGLTRTQYDVAQRGAMAAESGDINGFTMANAEVRQNAEIIVKRMEALRDLAHGDLSAASAAAGTDLRAQLFRPGVDNQTGMIEGYLWDLARWAEPLGRKLRSLDTETRDSIVSTLPELASSLDVVSMKARLTALAEALAKVDTNAAVGPPKNINFDGPIPQAIVGRAQAEVTPRPDLGLKREMKVEDAPTSEDWINDPGRAMAHNQVLMDQLVSGHASVPLGVISMDPASLPVYEAAGLIPLEDGRVGAPVYLEDGRVVLMRSHPEGGVYAVDISKGVKEAMLPAAGDPKVVNGDLSPFQWNIDEAGHFVVEGQSAANQKNQEIFKQQVKDIDMQGPDLGSTPDQLLQTATSHQFETPESYQAMLDQAAKIDKDMVLPTLRDAARYYPKDLAYKDGKPTQPVLDRHKDMTTDYLRQKMALEEVRHIAFQQMHSLQPINEVRPDIPRADAPAGDYRATSGPRRPLQTHSSTSVVTGIEGNTRGKWNMAQLGNFLEKQGLSSSQIDALHLDDAFSGRKTMSRTDLLTWLYENTLQTDVHSFSNEAVGPKHRKANSSWERQNDTYYSHTVTRPQNSVMGAFGGAVTSTRIEVVRNGNAWEAFSVAVDPDPNAMTGMREPLGIVSESPEAVMAMADEMAKSHAAADTEWTYPLTGGDLYEQVSIRSPLAAHMQDPAVQTLARLESQVKTLESEIANLEGLAQGSASPPMLLELQTAKTEHARISQELAEAMVAQDSGAVPVGGDTVASFTMDRHMVGDKIVDVAQEIHSNLAMGQRSQHKARVIALAQRYHLIPEHVDASNMDLNFRDLEERVRVLGTDWELEVLDADGVALDPVSEVPLSWEATQAGETELGALNRVNSLRTAGVKDSPLSSPEYAASAALKSAITRAAERGATHFAFTNGQINSARHNRVQLDRLKVTPKADGTIEIDYAGTGADTLDGNTAREGTRTLDNERQIADVLGTNVAELVSRRLGKTEGAIEFTKAELDEAVGAKTPWARELYDEALPRAAKKLIKKQKWDTKLEPLDLDYSAAMTRRGNPEGDFEAWSEGDRAAAYDPETITEKAHEAEMTDWTRDHRLEPRWPGMLHSSAKLRADAEADLFAYESQYGTWYPENGTPADWAIVDAAGQEIGQLPNLKHEQAMERYYEMGNDAIQTAVADRAYNMQNAFDQHQAELRDQFEHGTADGDTPPIAVEPLQMIKITPKMRRTLLGEKAPGVEDASVRYDLREGEVMPVDADNILQELGWDVEPEYQSGVGIIGKATPRVTKDGVMSLRGQTIADPETQATLMRPWRSKKTETMHYLLSGEQSGRVDGHLSYSSRLPGSTGLFDYSKTTKKAIDEAIEKGTRPEDFEKVHGNEISRAAHEMAQRIRRLEAQRNEKIVVDMVHNHPSGKVKPSDADIFSTEVMGIALEKEGVTLRHHMIINHDTYTVLRREGGGMITGEERSLPKFKFEADPLDVPEKPHFLLGHKARNPMEIAEIGGIINNHPDEFVGVLYSNAKLEAQGMEIIPKSWLKNPRMVEDWMRGRKREYGAGRVFMHHPDLDTTMTDTGSQLLQKGIIEDFVDDSGMSLQQSARPRTWGEQKALDLRSARQTTRVMEGKADYNVRMEALKYAEEGGSFSKRPDLFKWLTPDEKTNAMMGRLAKGYISNKKQLEHLDPSGWDESAPAYFGEWRPTEDAKVQMQEAFDAREAAFHLELETIDEVKQMAKGKTITDEALASIQTETLDKMMREDPALFDKFSRQYWRSYDSVLEAMDSSNGIDLMRAEAALDAIDDMITSKFESDLDSAEQFDMGNQATRAAADQLEKAAVYKNVEAEAQPWMRPMTVVGWRKQLMHSKELAAAVNDGRMDRDIYNNLFKGQTAMNDATQADLDTFNPLLEIIEEHRTFNESTNRFEGVGQDISTLLFRAIDGGIPASKLKDYSWTFDVGPKAKITATKDFPGASSGEVGGRKVEIRLDEWVPKIRKWYEGKIDALEKAQIDQEWTKAARAEKHLASITGQINRIFNATAASMQGKSIEGKEGWTEGGTAEDIIATASSRAKRGEVPLDEMIKLQKSLQNVVKKAETEVQEIEGGKYRRGNYITHVHNMLRPDIKRTLENEADPWMQKLSMQTPEVRFDFLNPRKEGLRPIEDFAHAFKIYSRAVARKTQLEPKLQEAFDLSRSANYDVAQRDYVDMLLKKLSGEKTDEQKRMRRRMTLSFLMDPKLRKEAKGFLAEDRLKAMQLMGDPSKAFSRRMTAAIYAYALNPAFVSGLNVLEVRSIVAELAHHIPDLMPQRGGKWMATGAARAMWDVSRESMSKARAKFFKTPVWQSEATRAHVLDYAHDTTTMMSKMMEGTSEQAKHSAMTQKATEAYFRASSLQWSESVLRAMSYYTLKQRNQFWGMSEADSQNFAAQLTRHIIPSFGPLDASPKLDTNLGRQSMALQRYTTGQLGDMGLHLGNIFKRPSGGAGNMPFPADRSPDVAVPRESTGNPARDAAFDKVIREPAEHGHRYDVDTATRWRSAAWIGAQAMLLKTVGWYGAEILMELFDKQGDGWSKAWPYEMRALGGVMMNAIVDIGEVGTYYSNPAAFEGNPRAEYQAKAALRRLAGLGTAMAVPGGAPLVGIGSKVMAKERKEQQELNKARPRRRSRQSGGRRSER